MKPWLWLPTKLAHDLSPLALAAYGFARKPLTLSWKARTWRGLHFANPLGIAGGVDKNARSLRHWWTLGPGFVEVGTVTPRPQDPNPGKIMARDIPARAVWNRMGFPSAGAKAVASQLEKIGRPYHTPVFVNIGKNRDTANERAYEDYAEVLCLLSLWADAFVVNISSPNTKNLRELQEPARLSAFLTPILEARAKSPRPNVPLLLKLSPDLETDSLHSALETSLSLGFDGWILTNTTLSRAPGLTFPTEGGVSGRPLASLSSRMLRDSVQILGARRNGKLLVSVGGVMSSEDVAARLECGADLVQVYTALIYEGPGLFRTVARHFTLDSSRSHAVL